jgi:hypothetical protein
VAEVRELTLVQHQRHLGPAGGSVRDIAVSGNITDTITGEGPITLRPALLQHLEVTLGEPIATSPLPGADRSEGPRAEGKPQGDPGGCRRRLD